ncbi:putative spermidine/putrescine transport system ATP-binding protein [Nocardioides marinisabuli]|uniref:Spermidine/putrescine import ATP-binding protein PotA n=1 Tax=Nocardioides marinisabuli TaxID=419476 RepID=A0A7Y9F0Y2_9ACTN|nr:ABC transporter ATP-binding protein [Nocardioides marinisabuli]NYD57598.1 putative spermidine/putrescine transport system ATP-binding protein [Nocardioides marinisabuli]
MSSQTTLDPDTTTGSAAGGPTSAGASISLRGVSRHFGDVVALDHVDLDIASGEFMTLLGASGSGKSTMLSLIAGFDDPTSGVVEVNGRALNGVPPHKRDIGMVFQNYALFPHMSVADNIAFSLKQRKVPKREITQRVGEALEVVELGGLGRRRPAALSGGQRQRVALARAIVFRPQILLMDEPLAALDKRLREQLQIELKRIHAELGITFVFVTHDQEEALAMSDRIALVHGGRIEQLGSVEEIYERPRTAYAADFIGESNLFEGTLVQQAGDCRVRTADGDLRAAAGHGRAGQDGALLVRPEKLQVCAAGDQPGSGKDVVAATVETVTYLGSATRVDARTASGRHVVARVPAELAGRLRPAESISICWEPRDAWLIPAPATDQAQGAGRAR